MNHSVSSVEELYEDAKSLMELCDSTSESGASAIINNLDSAIDVLKNNWEGKDAAVQIQNLIEVRNIVANLRNELAKLATAASKIASLYRSVQVIAGSGEGELSPLEGFPVSTLDNYEDERDTIKINANAHEALSYISGASVSLSGFAGQVQTYYNAILNNWTAGVTRDVIQSVFDTFISNVKSYQSVLSTVSSTVSNAINRYSN